MGGTYSTYEDRTDAYKFLVEKPEGRLDGNIKIDLQNKWDGLSMGWIDLSQYRHRWRALANAVMNLGFI